MEPEEFKEKQQEEQQLEKTCKQEKIETKQVSSDIKDIDEKEQPKQEIAIGQKDDEKKMLVANEYKKINTNSTLIDKDINLLNKKRIFWGTQPVMQLYDTLSESGPIEIQNLEDVRKQPYKLPNNFQWTNINLNDDKQLGEMYDLLTNNYVEDEDATFRFDYSREFLKWALLVPNYYPEWIVGIKNSKTLQLIGCITGVPVHVRIGKNQKEIVVKMAEINFLCVHKTLREKRVAPVLIKQITRRVNLRKKWQAIYTSGTVLPTPFTKAQYFHRSLNPKKLIEVNFSYLGKNQTISRLQKIHSVPQKQTLQNLRLMTKKDVLGVFTLLNKFFKYNCFNSDKQIRFKFTEDQVKHYFLPVQNVIYSYVICVKEGNNRKVTDFISFYHLPSHIIKHPKHKILKAAYSYYHVATSVSLSDLIFNALIIAKNLQFDVFNALNLMNNEEFIEELKFAPGNGYLNYYLYNWKLPRLIEKNELAIVLV